MIHKNVAFIICEHYSKTGFFINNRDKFTCFISINERESTCSHSMLNLIVLRGHEFWKIVTRNGKIFWKNGLNWSFYALMMRTKPYSSPFFFTMHQNVNKPNSRTVRAVYEPMFLFFYLIIVSIFFLFPVKM